MKLERKSNYVHEYTKNSILNDASKELGGCFGASDLLEYLLEDSEYSIRKYNHTQKSIFNRINMLWVYPLFLIQMPFQWLLCGDTGYKRESRVGRVLDLLVKFG
jgi:hypothetical protein